MCYCRLMTRHTCHLLEFKNSRFLQLLNLLLDHSFKNMVAGEPWQFSSSVILFILGPLNIIVYCNVIAIKGILLYI